MIQVSPQYQRRMIGNSESICLGGDFMVCYFAVL